MDFPDISKELLDELTKRFPDRCPDVGTPLEEVNAKAGEQRVLRFLVRMYQEQNENILHREVL